MQLTGQQKSALLLLAGFAMFLVTVVPALEWSYRKSLDQGGEPRLTTSLLLFFQGMFLVQWVMLGLWAALASVPLRKRVPTALATGTVLLLAASYATKRMLSIPYGFSGFSSLVTLLHWFTLGLMLFGVLSLARVKLHWRFTPFQPPDEAPALSGRHFTLRDLMLWTAGIGLALALGKWILEPTTEWFDTSTQPTLFTFLKFRARQTAFHGVPVLLAVLAMADRRRRWWWAMATTACTVLIPLGYTFYLMHWFGIRSGATLYFPVGISWGEILRDVYQPTVVQTLGRVCGVLGSLAILARGGWRLSRQEPTADLPTEPPEPHATLAKPVE